MKNPFDGRATLEGVIVATGVGPTMLELELGDMVVEKDTFPEKRLKVLTVIVETPGWPAKTVRLLVLAERLNVVSDCGPLGYFVPPFTGMKVLFQSSSLR